MGQASSYAESSVQRALLKLKREEQAEEDELLSLCGYRRPSASAAAPDAGDTVQVRTPLPESDSVLSSQSMGCNCSEKFTPPPESLGPFVSLAPEYYSLDELRDALRYLPDTLWVSLYRVSLLYILDNDHDGRVKSTDISFFMDWGIKTVGRDVPPEQLAERLQTYAALHCWRRCLHVGERIEMERAVAAAQHSGRGGPSGNTSAGRSRRRPLQSAGMIGVGSGVSGGNGSSPAHHYQRNQSVSSFMLLHLGEACFSSRSGGPVPLPSNAPTSADATAGASGGASKESPTASGEGGFSFPAATPLFSPRFAVTQPVTSTTRLEAAAHFAEWMLRLVQTQERDRRHERQRLERRLRLLAAPEMKRGNSRLRHSQLLQHHSMRLRGGSLAMVQPLAEAGDGEDIVTSQSCMSMRAGGWAKDVNDDSEPEVVSITAPRLSLPDSNMVADLPLNNSSSTSQAVMVTAAGGTPAKGASSPSSRSITPLGYAPALAKVQKDALESNSNDATGVVYGARLCPLLSEISPLRQRQRQPSRHLVASSVSASSSHVLPSHPCPLTANNNTSGQSEDNIFMSPNLMKDSGSHTNAAVGGGGGGGAAERQANSQSWHSPASSGLAPCSPHQLSAVLMDSEAFYVELELNGWCTIGAVEEVYLDFAVEDSYCLPFWAFCRLLNEPSADEVQAALELTTAQATALLTSATAVEEHRRAAAVRQLQRLHVTPQRTPGPRSGWERQVEVVPVFIVSEYTLVTFVAAFIHAYWDMLESMGADVVTQPTDMAASATALSCISPGLRAA
ncbi:hypothetical protein ABL78_8017 [Leptomonas seymouri]|uniref:Uncharacterized protein n=1 Tax=Leptomonas seymouri TaxID=5684 RepID=A0A0N1HRJ8_LEPSE|nr:hypothetical protein ABL78_8017 [Leptomonas seymouri]|eukprot:KPI82965.1 hypothetical protein ABL78_8017 [Leptomonas seymouri]